MIITHLSPNRPQQSIREYKNRWSTELFRYGQLAASKKRNIEKNGGIPRYGQCECTTLLRYVCTSNCWRAFHRTELFYDPWLNNSVISHLQSLSFQKLYAREPKVRHATSIIKYRFPPHQIV